MKNINGETHQISLPIFLFGFCIFHLKDKKTLFQFNDLNEFENQENKINAEYKNLCSIIP